MELFHAVGWFAGWIIFVALFVGYLASFVTGRSHFSNRWLSPLILVILLFLLLGDVKGLVKNLLF